MSRMQRERGKVRGRNSSNRRMIPILLYAAEGKNKTEKNYLQHFNTQDQLIVKQASGNDTDPVKMMTQLEMSVRELGLSAENGDMAFCLVDSDTDLSRQPQFDRAYQMENSVTRMIVSAPCFELWYLCHFKVGGAFLDSKMVLKKLEKFLPDYDKSTDVYSRICEKTQTAIENAGRLRKIHEKNGTNLRSISCNPRTDVDLVLEYIMNVLR